MKPKTKRLNILLISMLSLACAAFLVLKVFEENIVFFYTPADTLVKQISSKQRVRIGGTVEVNSLQKGFADHEIRFRITDSKHSINVTYNGMVPDLFKAGKAAVAEGYLVNKSSFVATNILAKHDENYKPPGVPCKD